MAKKRKKSVVRNIQKDTHHICWQARNWGRPCAKKLRSMVTEIIDIELHRYIHSNMSNVPTPPEKACYDAIKRFDCGIEGLLPKIVWLAENVDYAPFQEAMWRQYRVVQSYKKPRN